MLRFSSRYKLAQTTDFLILVLLDKRVDIDYETGIAFFMKALEQGCLLSNNNLGLAYSDGNWFTPDYKKAITYFNQAIAADVYVVYYNLGLMYLQGKGVKKIIRKRLNFLR